MLPQQAICSHLKLARASNTDGLCPIYPQRQMERKTSAKKEHGWEIGISKKSTGRELQALCHSSAMSAVLDGYESKIPQKIGNKTGFGFRMLEKMGLPASY